ncbi:MAG TPA: phytanoyl-CoA dioxygenase family protein [Acidimicrobiales bacterium]|jgi:hypothetical protein|nr:phytanoyl-CoA dioxygenase family protein [Acidimicrobiales bacterium]
MRPTFFDPQLQDTLDTQGFAVLDLLDDDQVTALVDAYERLGRAPGDPERACISTFHTYDKDYKAATHEAVQAVLAPVLAETFDRQRALPSNFLVKWPGGFSGFGLHQDLSLVDEREHRSVEVWIGLCDIDDQNGQLWMVPGSHRWMPTLRGIQSFPFPFGQVTRRIIEDHAVPVPIRAGQAIVFNHATLHFSMPNRTDDKRLVAIADLIPEEAEHLHFFGDGDGGVDVYRIGDEFWVDNSPFTLWQPPPDSQRIGAVDWFTPHELTDDDLDELVRTGRAVVSDASPTGAINAAKRWCHRCGSTDLPGDGPDRWTGNVTLLCASCEAAEVDRAPSPAHVGS